MYKTIFFKRQSDILNLIIRDNIIPIDSEVLIPSYICSEVINSFECSNINLSFYDREVSHKELNNLIAKIKKQKTDKIFLYYYLYYSNLNKVEKILKKIKNLKINIILDIAHIVNFDLKIINSILPSYNLENAILIASPRKYLKLSQGGYCKINNNFLKIKNNSYDFYSIFIDIIKSSYVLRAIFSNIKFLRKKKNNFYKSINIIEQKEIKSASIGHQIYFKMDHFLNKNINKAYYQKYLNLFKKFINQENKDSEDKFIYWIIPLNKKNKKINSLLKYFKERLDNPLMRWPDYHKNLSSKDKLIYENNIYFRIDKNTCNSNMYKKISSILK